MIITVTLNPAVDKTVEINDVHINRVNRVSSVRLDAGGKGINVSKIILSLGGKSRAIGFLGGKAGAFIKEYLDEMGIANEFVFIEGESRTNLKIVDPLQQTNTDINESGPEITEADIKQIDNYLSQSVSEKSVMIFSGSVPPNMENDIYQKWIYGAKKKGARTLLDADGELLRLGIEAGPYLIKPNIHELERLLDRKIVSVEEAVEHSRTLMEKYGIEIVVVSLGEKGALFLNKEVALLAEGITVAVKSTVGAGDSMVAALAYAIDEGYAFEKAATLAVAAGTANVMTCGTEPSSLKVIEKLEKEVKWKYL
ncbi:1-phosphofructokinase [Sporomusaceae bacterium BoRhaA]|uniref:1-phosphofructokinase n=1 Tax=Pelorhabdus rhamnosifermentans TaxID=2772457 RepID=UPI001C061182|nr:1-phosphofructokinase [Pelorhabdus rhamnosifermentans]MBU2703562.1 1-phosphofructokinase [Pelorhabdus rhamnosifermentans]